jgi:tetratricopeptide (TPR) repeat protein
MGIRIKRDYSQPFFSTRRRRRHFGRFLFIYGLILGGFLTFAFTQQDRIQLAALDMVGMAPTSTPFASWWAEQGYNQFLQGQLEQALVSYENAVRQQPDNINYLYEFGRTLIELNRDAVPGDPNRSISDAERASQVGDHALEVAPQDVRSYTLKATALVWNGDSESAIPIGLQGIEVNNAFAPLLATLARAYTDIGRYQQGLTYGEDAIRVDPYSQEAHRAYAYALILVGERQQAIRQLEDAVAINPNMPAPFFELALQYRSLERFQETIAAYEAVLTMQPRNVRALFRMCETFSMIGQDDQARGYCEDAITSDPTFARSYRALGMVDYRRRNYEGAIENFNICTDLGSSELECYYLKGLSHYYLGNCDDAWNILGDSLTRVQATGDNSSPVVESIQSGLRLVTENCTRYSGQALPTLIPPTVIPPTPIGIG